MDLRSKVKIAGLWVNEPCIFRIGPVLGKGGRSAISSGNSPVGEVVDNGDARGGGKPVFYGIGIGVLVIDGVVVDLSAWGCLQAGTRGARGTRPRRGG